MGSRRERSMQIVFQPNVTTKPATRELYESKENLQLKEKLYKAVWKQDRIMDDSPNHYLKFFDTRAYIKQYCSSMGGSLVEEDIFTWFADRYHEIFDTGMVMGARLLDIGTGPNIYSVVSASKHCDSILLSDFAPQNRDALAEWLDGRSPHSFHHVFEYIAAKEGQRELASERELRLKRMISAILPLNILQNQPFAPCYVAKADIITSSLCLEATTTEYDEYKKAIKRVMSLLETGGHIVFNGVLSESFYVVGDVKFKTCSVTSEEVKAAWTESGLQILTWREQIKNKCDQDDCTGLYIIHGQKLT